MGSGINLPEALGQLTHYGLDQKVVTVCGDSTFFHTILPGLVILTTVLRAYGVETISVSSSGVREGYLLSRVIKEV